jgi:hypothetical protein
MKSQKNPLNGPWDPLLIFASGADVDAAVVHILEIHPDHTVSTTHMLGKRDAP